MHAASTPPSLVCLSAPGNIAYAPLSQVLHIRNLPYETTEEELRELCANFGPIVQTKLNVGANKNQAFVEFPEMQMAINMVSYYANSADPAKVRARWQAPC